MHPKQVQMSSAPKLSMNVWTRAASAAWKAAAAAAGSEVADAEEFIGPEEKKIESEAEASEPSLPRRECKRGI